MWSVVAPREAEQVTLERLRASKKSRAGLAVLATPHATCPGEPTGPALVKLGGMCGPIS